MNVLEVKNLKVVFPGAQGVIRAVEGVDLQIARGECLALVGESGCGKSVTSRALMKLLPENAAYRMEKLEIAGMDVTHYTEKQMQKLRGKRISIVFQDALSALNPVMPVGKQLEEVFRYHTELSRREAKERSVEALASVGIPNPERRCRDYPHELSGGMRQRVLIAMAFACHPDVILADEPTTALDVTIQAQVLELLARLQREQNTGLLLITHDLSVVRRMADRIAVMYSGKIVEEAPAEELFRRPLHPYTRGLMDSVASIQDTRGAFSQIPGHLPNPADKPRGCYFAPRCRVCGEKCREQAPKWSLVTPDRRVRCWNWEAADHET